MVVRIHGGIITDQTLTGSLRYFEIDGGVNVFANTIGDGNFRAQYVTVADGGASYTVGDVLTITGGTGTAPTFTVGTVDDGVVTGVTVTTDGDLSVAPANPASTSGGTGTGATLNVEYTSNIIVPGAGQATAGTGEYYVPYDSPVPGSAAEQVLEIIAQRANIVQIAILSDDLIQVAVENTGFGWVVSDDDLRDAIRALGAAVVVPDETTDGATVDLTAATVTERFFSNGISA